MSSSGKITNVNHFFKTTVIRIKALYRCAENNVIVTKNLQEMEKLMQYTVAPTNGKAIKLAKKIAKQYDQLKAILEKMSWEKMRMKQRLKPAFVASFKKSSAHHQRIRRKRFFF